MLVSQKFCVCTKWMIPGNNKGWSPNLAPTSSKSKQFNQFHLIRQNLERDVEKTLYQIKPIWGMKTLQNRHGQLPGFQNLIFVLKLLTAFETFRHYIPYFRPEIWYFC